IKRGRLDLFLNVERSYEADFTFNEPVLRAYINAIEKLKKEFSIPGELDLVQLVRAPGIMNLEGSILSAEGRQEIEDGIVQAAEMALRELEHMRAEEGVALRNDIVDRLIVIHGRVQTIRKQVSGALDAYQERLKIRLSELLRGTPVDPNRLVQEAAFYVE